MTANAFFLEIKKIVKLLPRQLISTTVFFWTYPLSLIVAVLFVPANTANAGQFGIWIIIGFISHTAMYPFVLYGKSEQTLSLQVLLVITMGVARGAVIGIFAPIFGVQDSISVLERVLNSAIVVFYWSQAGAIIVEYGITFKIKVKEILSEILEKKIVRMPHAAKASSNELLLIIGHLQERIIEIVGPSPTPANLQKAAGEIDSLVGSHIRPLAQSTWRNGELIWFRASFFSVLKRTLSTQRIPVFGVILLTFPFSVVSQITRIGLTAACFVQFVWISIIYILYTLNYRNTANLTTLRTNIRFLILMLFISYPVTFFLQFLLPLSDNSSLETMIKGYAISSTTQIALFIVGAQLISLYDDHEFAFLFLREIIQKGELESLLEKTRMGNADENFAQYLHAEVQSQLLACKLLLLKAAESDFALFSPEITEQILDRMEKIKQPYKRPASRIPSQRIEELSRSWAGLAEISYDLSPGLYELHSYSDATSQLIEEAVVNSVRHGGASKIRITSVQREYSLEIAVRDNGKMADSKSGSGIGSILFETFTQSWSLTRHDEATILTFTIDTLEKKKIS